MHFLSPLLILLKIRTAIGQCGYLVQIGAFFAFFIVQRPSLKNRLINKTVDILFYLTRCLF